MLQLVITWLPALLACLLALFLAYPAFTRLRARRRERGLIRNYGVAQLSEVLLDDGMGGKILFDHLLLTPQGIMALLRQPCQGAIFAGERMDQWAQVVGKRTYRFTNPLHALDEQLATLRYHLPGLPLEGRILFCGACEFPKGRPDRLLLLVEMDSPDRGVSPAVQPVLEQGWKLLQERAEQAPPGLSREAGQGDGMRLTIAGGLFLLGGGWLLWRLLAL